jgi:hypothetical protein
VEGVALDGDATGSARELAGEAGGRDRGLRSDVGGDSDVRRGRGVEGGSVEEIGVAYDRNVEAFGRVRGRDERAVGVFDVG